MLDGSRVRVDAVAALVLVTQQSVQFVVLGLCSVMVIDTTALHIHGPSAQMPEGDVDGLLERNSLASFVFINRRTLLLNCECCNKRCKRLDIRVVLK